MLQYFTTTVPNASWQTLAGGLYYKQEQSALERVAKYFQRQPGIKIFEVVRVNLVVVIFVTPAMTICNCNFIVDDYKR